MLGGGFVTGFGGSAASWKWNAGLQRPVHVNSQAGSEGILPKEDTAQGKLRFPLRAGLTAGGLTLAGDTAAQFYARSQNSVKKSTDSGPSLNNLLNDGELWTHDWIRALRMSSYGFLLYGPGSHFWYQLLDGFLPVRNLQSFSLKVAANQLIFGPIVVAVIFFWNSIWQGNLHELPDQYRHLAFPTLVNGWKFWTPASFLNFGLVPLQARVAFMSTCAIFWNFYLSMTLSGKEEVASVKDT